MLKQIDQFKYLTITFVMTVFVATIWMATNRHSSKNYKDVFNWDSEGYYLYLPAVFINHGFEELHTKTATLQGDSVFKKYPGTTKVFTKYTNGVAILSLPFFVTAHAWVMLSGSPSNFGFAPPYALAMIVAVAFYMSLGFYFLLLILYRHFRKSTAIVTCLIVWLGTNLLCYSALIPGYAHPFSFFVAAVFVYYTPLYYERKQLKHLLIIAFALSLLTLLRPTDVVFLLYFVMYGVDSTTAFFSRIKAWVMDWKGTVLFPIAICIIYIPQFAYWKYISGHWIVYSYQEERFSLWKHPMLPEIWYHPLNGLFLYEPLLLLSIIGIGFTWRKNVLNSRWIFLIFMLTSYISASWWFWTFGTSYGYRPFIDFLPLLAIPLAISIERISTSRFKTPLLCIVFFFLFVSVRMNFTYSWTWQGENWGWNEVLNCYINAILLR